MLSRQLEKLICKEAALKIMGSSGNVSFRRGTPVGDAVICAIRESKCFYDMLVSDAPLTSITQQLNKKRAAAKTFKRLTGLVWRF